MRATISPLDELRIRWPEVEWGLTMPRDRDGAVLVATRFGQRVRCEVSPRLDGNWWEALREPVQQILAELGLLELDVDEQKLRAYSGARGWTPEDGDLA